MGEARTFSKVIKFLTTGVRWFLKALTGAELKWKMKGEMSVALGRMNVLVIGSLFVLYVALKNYLQQKICMQYFAIFILV